MQPYSNPRNQVFDADTTQATRSQVAKTSMTVLTIACLVVEIVLANWLNR